MMQQVFDRMFKRKRCYRALFFNEKGELKDEAKVVLADLANFCKAYRPTTFRNPVTGQSDPVLSALADGRREVWLRLQESLYLDEQALMKLRQESTND